MTEIHEGLPPGQIKTDKLPAIHTGPVPTVDLNAWQFRIFGLVEQEKCLTWGDLLQMPRYTVTTDVHCVTTWTHADNHWEGVAFHTVMMTVNILPEANFALIHAENGYTVGLDIDDLLREGVMLAYKHDGKPLTPEHGFPVRLVVPHRYFWKSAKWVTGVEFLAERKLGFWEQRGYHKDGDPWLEQRYSD